MSDVTPGDYWLRAEIDPDDIVRESNEVNAAAYSDHQLRGPSPATRQPGRRRHGRAGGPATIPLSTTSFGTGLGTRTFRIIEPPRHGTVSPAPGPTFTSTSVVYTPLPGWVGPDHFTYTVQNSTSSSFPRYPTRRR